MRLDDPFLSVVPTPRRPDPFVIYSLCASLVAASVAMFVHLIFGGAI